MANSRRTTLVIFAIGFTMRIASLRGQSLTMDEIGELAVSKLPWLEIIVAESRFPPLYHLLLKSWIGIFRSDTSGHWLSVVLGLGTLAFAYKLAVRASGKQAGLFVLLLVAMSPYFVWYSQELRMYGLCLFLATATIYYSFKTLDTNAMKDRIAFVVLTLFGMYTHYFFATIVISLLVVVFVETNSWESLRPRLADVIVVSIFALPTLWLLYHDLQREWGYARTQEFSFLALGYAYFSYFSGYCLGPSLRVLHSNSGWHSLSSFLPWLTVFSILTFWTCATVARSIERKWTIRLAAVLVLPLMIVGGANRFAEFGFNVRHVSWCALPLYLLWGIGLSRIKRSAIRFAFTIAFMACFSVSLANRFTSDDHRNEDMRNAANWLETQNATVPAFVISGYMATPLKYYLKSELPLISMPDVNDGVDRRRRVIEIAHNLTGQEEFYWLVYSRPFHDDPDGRWRTKLVGSRQPAATFAGVDIYRVDASRRSPF